jgi:hypothetical protein
MSTEYLPENLFSVPDLVSEVGTHDVFLHPHHSPAVARGLMEIARKLVGHRGRGTYEAGEAADAVHGMFIQASVSAGAKGEVVRKDGEDDTARRRRWREFSCSSVSSGEHAFYFLFPILNLI